MRRLSSYFSLKTPLYFVYMLQQVEYKAGPFLAWTCRQKGSDARCSQSFRIASMQALLARATWPASSASSSSRINLAM